MKKEKTLYTPEHCWWSHLQGAGCKVQNAWAHTVACSTRPPCLPLLSWGWNLVILISAGNNGSAGGAWLSNTCHIEFALSYSEDKKNTSVKSYLSPVQFPCEKLQKAAKQYSLQRQNGSTGSQFSSKSASCRWPGQESPASFHPPFS